MTEPSNERESESSKVSSVEAERRQITVLFSDIVDFTPMAEKLGDEEIYELIRRLTAEQETIIHSHGGIIQDFSGDGIMAVFGAPAALEDAPLRACRAALDIQSRMRQIQRDLHTRYGVTPDLRIGINSGTAVVGKMGDSQAAASSALGSTVNVASRVEGAAEPATVVISSTTHALVSPFVKTVPLGERQLKGMSKPEALFRLEEIRKGVARFEAARQKGLIDLIGRTQDLETLLEEWQRAKAERPVTVNIVGEAGIGKSRLIYEFRQAIPRTDGLVLQGQCLSDSATPFAPFIDVIKCSFGIEESVSPAEIERCLRTGLEDLGLDAAETLPYLLNLLGQQSGSGGQTLEPTAAAEVVGVRSRKALRDIIERQCDRSRVALIIEDLHWIDTASEEVLQSICTSPNLKHLLIVASYRPTYTPPWALATNVTSLQLVPLSAASLVDLIKARLDTDELPERLVQLVVDRSDGNPLFAEELTAYLVHKGIITRTEVGIEVDPEFNPAGLPASLENLLMERVDHLDEGPRAVIRVASVVGRRFASSIVQESGDLNGHFSDDLNHLRNQELIFPDVETTYTDHIFKHALVQDAVYRTLLRPDREELHRRVGLVIEENYSDKIDEVSDILAHHFANGRVPSKAARYMALAGHRALKLVSLDEAELRLRQVIEIAEESPDAVDDELFADVLIDLLHLTCWRYDFAEMLDLSQRYLPRVERFGESRQLSRVLQWAGEALICAGRFDEADAALNRALRLGEKLQDKESTMFALWDLMWLCSVRPDDRPNDYIAKTGRIVLEYADELNDYYHHMAVRYLLSVDCLERGHIAEAEKWAQQSLDFGRQTGFGPAVSIGLMFLALCHALHEQFEPARELSEEAIGRSVTDIERALGLAVKGVVLMLQGQFGEARDLLAHVRKVAHEDSFQVLLTSVEIPYGAALVFSGDVKEGLSVLENAIEMFSEWRNARMVAWAHLVLGEIHLHMATSGEDPAVEGLREADRHLWKAVRVGQSAGTDGHVAEAMLNLGLLAKVTKQFKDSKAHLDEARRVAESLGWPELVSKIETARAKL